MWNYFNSACNLKFHYVYSMLPSLTARGDCSSLRGRFFPARASLPETVMKNDCIFCKILAGELPSVQVYADDAVVAFLDIAPVVHGHTLIIPRGHYPTLFEVPPELAAPLLAATQRVGAALMRALQAEGVNVMQNNFSAAGQMVFHAHWHVIPRFSGDGLSLWRQGAYASNDEMRDFAGRIAAQT